MLVPESAKGKRSFAVSGDMEREEKDSLDSVLHF